MSNNYIDNHVERALGLLVSQFFDSEKLKALVASVVQEIQDIDSVAWGMTFQRDLNTAFGLQLDGLGDIVGEPRNGRDDEDYREALRFRVFINGSFPTPPAIINAVRVATDASLVLYWEYYPASVQLYTNGENIDFKNLNRFIQGLLPAGVQEVAITVSPGIDHPLVFSRDILVVPLIHSDGTFHELFEDPEDDRILAISARADDAPVPGGFLVDIEPQVLLLDDGGPFLLEDGNYLQILDSEAQEPLLLEDELNGQWSEVLLKEHR